MNALKLAWYIASKLVGIGRRTFTSLILKICIATTAISIAVMTIAMSLIHGFQQEITHKIYHFWGHITISHIDVTVQNAPAPITMNDIDLDELMATTHADIQIYSGKLSNLTDKVFRHAHPFILYPGMIKRQNSYEGIQLKGLNVSFDQHFLDLFLSRGKIPQWAADSLGSSPSRDILISEITARRMKIDLGDQIEIYFLKDKQQVVRRFQICGIYKTGLEEYDRKVAFVDAAVLQQILGWESNQYSGFEVFVSDKGHIDPALDFLYEEHLDPQFLPVGIRSRFPSIFEWLDLQDYNRVVILLLMIVVCIFNISTTVIVLIIERKTMIGLLKAMGMPFKTLQMIFVLFCLRIWFWSFIIGNVLGLGLCFLQERFQWVKLDETDYYLSYAPIHIPWMQLLFLNVGIVFLLFLCLWIPSSYIQRIDPVKVIQFR